MSAGPRRPQRVVVEADGGSRGNPGPAAYGAVLRDADTGELIAEEGAAIGLASNNVAEYSGLIAGLKLARDHAPGAAVEVRMDSKLVVEQMSGRWKVKHPDMRVLHAEASDLAPAGTTYTWIPRLDNSEADRLVNEALDGRPTASDGPSASPAQGGEQAREGASRRAAGIPSKPGDRVPDEPESAVEEAESPASAPGAATTLVLLRHGVTPHTTGRRFSGGLGGDNPGLSDEGRAQVAEAAEWLAELKDRIDVVVCSPVRRTRESAEILAEKLGLPLAEEPGFAEMEFGAWDGLTFTEVAERDQAGLDAWFSDLAATPPGGESFLQVRERVLAALDRLLEEHRGRTVVVVSHVTPIKTLVAHALGAPLEALFRMELAPASLTVLAFHPDTRPEATGEWTGSMRLYNTLAPGRRTLLDTGRW